MAIPGFFPCTDPQGLPWSSCVFSQALTTFDQVIRQAMTEGVIADALYMLWLLGTMALVMLIVWWMMADDMDQLMANLLVFGVKVSFFAEFIHQAFPWAMLFADGAIHAGLTLGLNRVTLEEFHDPGALMWVGWKLLIPLFTYLKNLGILGATWHLLTAVLYAILSLIGWAAVLWIGFNVFIGWIELVILAALAVPYLVFLIFGHTAFIAGGLLPTLAAAGIRQGVLATLIALIFPLMASLQMTDGSDPGLDTALAMAGILFGFCLLTFRAQQIAASITGVSGAFVGGGLVMLTRSAKQGAASIQTAMSSMQGSLSALQAAVSAIRQPITPPSASRRGS